MDVSRGGCCVTHTKKTPLIEITCPVDVNAVCELTCERSNMRFENSFEQPNLSLTHNILSVPVILWSVFGNY